MAQSKPPTAFIGLGAMGFGMTTNLVREGYPVTGFDIYGPTLDKFRKLGGLTVRKPAAATAGKDFCVCMVATKEQAQDVLLDGEEAAIKTLPVGAVLLLCSTAPCRYVQGLERELAERGRGDIALIDCLVSGGAIRAADGTLSIMAGASDASSSTRNVRSSQVVLVAIQILSASEAMGLATHLELDLKKAGQTIIGSEGSSWMFENRLPRMLDLEFKPHVSAVTIILKDTSIITSEARRAGFATPMTTTAEQVYFSGLARGYGSDDDSSLIRLYTDDKGKVGPVKPLVKDEAAKLRLVVNLLRGLHLCAAAETIAYAQYVGLDLDQVLELSVSAAGGSKILSREGQKTRVFFE